MRRVKIGDWTIDIDEVLEADYDSGTVFRVQDLILSVLESPDDFAFVWNEEEKRKETEFFLRLEHENQP